MGGEVKRAGKLVGGIGVAEGRGGRTRDDQQVARRDDIDPVATKEFAHQAADAVARRRATDLAAGRDPESRWSMVCVAADHDEMRQRLTPPPALQRQKFMALAEPDCLGKTL